MNKTLGLALASLLALAVLSLLLFGGPLWNRREAADRLVVYCAAGLRYPVEEIVARYEDEYQVAVELQYGGSNTLLSQIEVNPTGDLYLAADESYVQQARDKGLAEESIALCRMKPVIVVPKSNPKAIASVEDLARAEVKVALANPEAAAVGRKIRRLLTASGHWEAIARNATDHGVFKPTVNEVANDVEIGAVDAGVVWDSTAAQYAHLEIIPCPELDAGQATVEAAVLTRSADPTSALRLARFLAARDRGAEVFRAKGFEAIDGDPWEFEPQLTLFAGAVNRRALEPVLKRFADREGVQLTTKFNGCGILTADMRAIEANQESGFPDTYMACDVYYLDQVQDLFEQGVVVSDTRIVIVVQPGNPKEIRTLEDLARPGVRVAVGQPEQCTIGVLTRRLLENAGIYDQVQKNVVTQTATSALLVPNITTGSADAVLAYETDTRAESDKLEVIPIASPLATAMQPFSLARSSRHKQLSQRLFEAIAKSRTNFEALGFHWRLDSAREPVAASNPE